jgi:dephospho-CoA kinase
VRLFVGGISCAGKTTLARHLRASSSLNVVDMDDEIGRFNGGTWPDIPTKNSVVLPKVLAEVRSMSGVVLFGSLPVERTQELRQAGFATALLDVPPAELRRRHAVRLAQEGWTNVEWFEHEQSVIRDLRASKVFDHILDGEGTVESVAADIMKLVEDLRES